MSEPDICPGRCNHAWEAAERRQHETGETHELHPTYGQPIWCPECRDTIESRLRELPRLARTLATIHGKLPTLQAETGTQTPTDIHASPSPAYDLHDEFWSWVERNTQDTATRLNHTPKPTIGYLAGHLTHILTIDPDGIDFGHATLNWHRRLTTATGDQDRDLIHRIPGQCPHCNHRGTMRRKNGEDLVKCRHCAACWDYDHWQLLVKAVLEAAS